MANSQDGAELLRKRSDIVRYWNAEQLCSLESSTSHSHPDLAYLDNHIENHVLAALLRSNGQIGRARCLDVGAGYGRFTSTFRKFYSEIVLLEAAPSIYGRLQALWREQAGVSCVEGTFESFESDAMYDLIFASGVVYLYDDCMVDQFMAKARLMLGEGGLLVFRDFIAEPQVIIKSAYIKEGSCHYRSPSFWYEVADKHGFQVLDAVRSKPRLRPLRRPSVLKVLTKMRATKILRYPWCIAVVHATGGWQSCGDDIRTSYIVMRA